MPTKANRNRIAGVLFGAFVGLGPLSAIPLPASAEVAPGKAQTLCVWLRRPNWWQA